MTLRLYYSPGACSLSPHIALREAGLPFEIEAVTLSSHKTKSGDDFYAKSPKGQVPVLELNGGDILTEGAAIVQYVADKAPAAKLAPPNGTMERVRLQEWLNFIATEVHKGYSPLFGSSPEEVKAPFRERLMKRLAYVAKHLASHTFLLGDAFSVADAYLFTVLRWSAFTGVDLSTLPVLEAYVKRVGERPAVQAALAAEGLLKAS